MAVMTFEDRTPRARHPIGAFLAAFPIACFPLALLTDLAYWRTADLMWQNFSAWLLFAGLVGGGLAVVAWATHRLRPFWPRAAVNLLVLVSAFFDSLVHAGDGWTGVVPWGIALSALTVGLMLISAVVRPRRSTASQG